MAAIDHLPDPKVRPHRRRHACVSLTLDVEHLDHLRAYAEAQGMSLAGVVRRALLLAGVLPVEAPEAEGGER